MPVVIKRDQPPNDPKSKDPKAKTAPAKPAAKASTKPAAAGAKSGKKGAKAEPNEMPKLIGLGAVIVLALGFFIWYMFFSGGGTPPEPTLDKGPAGASTTLPGGPATNGVGTGDATGRRSGGLSTGEGAAPAGRGLGRGTEGTQGGGEGIE
jgi:hypothetical protein